LLYGGAASAKSWSLALFLVKKLYAETNIGCMVVRKTLPAVKTSCLKLIKHWLDLLEIDYIENKVECYINIVGSGSSFYFVGLDDVEKKKSFEGINYVWIEEATEITKKEYIR